MSEKALWKWLSNVRRTHQPIHIERLENSVGVGMPDVQGCWRGVPFFVELKQCREPAGVGTICPVKVRDSQIEWHNERMAAGGRSFFLIQVGNIRYLLPWHTYRAKPLRVSDMRELTLVEWNAKQGDVLAGLTNAHR